MATPNAAVALGALISLARQYGAAARRRKRVLLATLSRSTLASARQVFRLHEQLCFLDAYPDDPAMQALVRRMLRSFHRRRDLCRFRAELAATGIAGTDTPFRFFWPTARWIATRWPGALVLDRSDPDHARAILGALPLLLGPAQAEWVRKWHPLSLDVLDRLKRPGVTDADFFIRLVESMPGDDFTREAFFDGVDPPFILRAGASTPERTTPHLDWIAPRYRQVPFDPSRPALRREARRPPRRVTRLGLARARALIHAARVSMITRERDLEVFEYANAGDAFLIDDGDGLGFAMIGMLPARRALLPAVYGGLILQNGVPTGYVQVDVLGRHAEISFNTFETFRDAEARRVFARWIAGVHHVFDCDGFSIEPYQLGAGNDEGIASGAWWFYHRFGFRPRAAAARRLAARERARIAANPRHRSSARTLFALSKHPLFFSLAPVRTARLPRTEALLAAAVREGRKFAQLSIGAQRRAAVAAARERLGAGRRYRSARAESRVWEQWAWLALALCRGRWLASERRTLLEVIEAKWLRSELTYHRRLLRHARLRRALDC